MIELRNTEEKSRLEFLEARDGREGAMEFALRSYEIYKRLLLNAKLPSKNRASDATHNFQRGGYTRDPDFRKGFIRSCLSFREYIRKYRNVEKEKASA
jgi:hypothetical protein